MTVGIPFRRWGERPFVSSPFPYPADLVEHYQSEVTALEASLQNAPHPISLALEWKKMLDADPALNRAGLAKKHGISRARISQLMSLLTLPAQIQTTLRSLSTPTERRFFSERRLRPILLSPSGSEQTRGFNRLRQQFAKQCASASS